MKIGKYKINFEIHPFNWLLWRTLHIPKPVYKNGVRQGRVMRTVKFRGPITISSDTPLEERS